MALKLVKSKSASNKPQTPYKNDQNNQISLVLDRLTILVDAASETDAEDIRGSIWDYLVDNERFKQSPKKNGYKVAGDLQLEGNPRKVFIQALPNNHGKALLRLDMNPSKLGSDGLGSLHSDLVCMMPNGFQYLIEHGRISRIDVAADLPMEPLGLEMNDFHFVPQLGLTRRDYGVKGKLQTIYLGQPRGNQWRIYRKDIEQQKKKRVLSPTIRVERVRKNPGTMMLANLIDLPNPFYDTRMVHKLPPKPSWAKDWQWTMFQDCVAARGITPALALLPVHRRNKYREYLKTSNEKWWDPKAIWQGWPAFLDELRIIDLANYP